MARESQERRRRMHVCGRPVEVVAVEAASLLQASVRVETEEVASLLDAGVVVEEVVVVQAVLRVRIPPLQHDAAAEAEAASSPPPLSFAGMMMR